MHAMYVCMYARINSPIPDEDDSEALLISFTLEAIIVYTLEIDRTCDTCMYVCTVIDVILNR
jgi:hypothetical protein